jgi:hypothetical protein
MHAIARLSSSYQADCCPEACYSILTPEISLTSILLYERTMDYFSRRMVLLFYFVKFLLLLCTPQPAILLNSVFLAWPVDNNYSPFLTLIRCHGNMQSAELPSTERRLTRHNI